jgi:ubiquinone/menaquinone biosynthesis C-methylase UbiE
MDQPICTAHRNNGQYTQEDEHRHKREYTKQAETYDVSRFSDRKGRLYVQHTSDLLAHLVKSFVPAAHQSLVLDVATGTGRAALALAPSQGSVIGIDVAEAMVRVASEKAQRLGLENIRFLAGSALRLPFKDGTFDAIVCLRFFHFVPRPAWVIIIQEMFRVLKPNGVLILEFLNPFYGVGIRFCRRLFSTSTRSPVYLWPFQLCHICPGVKLRRVVGTYLPLVQLLSHISVELALTTLKLSRRWPFSHIASQKWYVLAKG